MKKIIIGIITFACIPFVVKAENYKKNSISIAPGYSSWNLSEYNKNLNGMSFKTEYERRLSKNFAINVSYTPEIHIEKNDFRSFWLESEGCVAYKKGYKVANHSFISGIRFGLFGDKSTDGLIFAINTGVGFGFITCDGSVASDCSFYMSGGFDLGYNFNDRFGFSLSPQIGGYPSNNMKGYHIQVPLKFKVNF
jgi:hypothetical protein